MEIGHIIPHIEALVFASDKPLTPIDITDLINNAFGFMDDKITMEQVQTAIEGIVEKYRSEFYPFEMRESGGGWQFLTKKDYHKTVAQLNGEKFLKRLSTAALETLAIIAYKQPLTKAEIESIRGVNCDYSIQKLLEKELIVISGRNEELPGKPLIYNTSRTFMDYFGINSPDDLPKLKEIFNADAVIPTAMHEGDDRQPEEMLSEEGASSETDATAALIVTENGELLEERAAGSESADTGASSADEETSPSPEQEGFENPAGERDASGDFEDAQSVDQSEADNAHERNAEEESASENPVEAGLDNEEDPDGLEQERDSSDDIQEMGEDGTDNAAGEHDDDEGLRSEEEHDTPDDEEKP